MPRRLRLDAELVRRGLARSREHAGELITGRTRERVRGGGGQAGHRGHDRRGDRGARRPGPARLRLARRAQAGRSAGGVRTGRPRRQRTPLPGRRRLDRRLHRRAAARTGRARWWPSTWGTASWPGRCRATSGSSCTTARTSATLTLEVIGGPVDLVVGDLSFISLELVLDALVAVTAPDGDLALMVKPQFEVGQGSEWARAAWCASRSCARRPCRRSPPRPSNVAGDARAVHGQPAPGPLGQRGVLPVAATRPDDSGRRRHPPDGVGRLGSGGCG